MHLILLQFVEIAETRGGETVVFENGVVHHFDRSGPVFNFHLYLDITCVAVCCSVLQCVAVCCSVLQWVIISMDAGLSPTFTSIYIYYTQISAVFWQCVARCCVLPWVHHFDGPQHVFNFRLYFDIIYK